MHAQHVRLNSRFYRNWFTGVSNAEEFLVAKKVQPFYCLSSRFLHQPLLGVFVVLNESSGFPRSLPLLCPHSLLYRVMFPPAEKSTELSMFVQKPNTISSDFPLQSR